MNHGARWEATEQARAQSSSCAYMTRSTTIKLNSAETCKNLEITTCYLSTYHKSRLFSIKLSLFFFFLCHDEMINLITLKRRHSSSKAMMMMRSFFCCARARAISEEFNFPRTYGGFLSLIGIWFFDPPDFSPVSWLSSLSQNTHKNMWMRCHAVNTSIGVADIQRLSRHRKRSNRNVFRLRIFMLISLAFVGSSLVSSSGSHFFLVSFYIRIFFSLIYPLK